MISGNPLRITNNKLKKSLEKLSSAYRINRAGDGPAELAVSQAMRAEIIEMDRCRKNAKDGISLVQTAEGALAEVHDMLDRLLELSGQAANGTYVDTDRDSLQREVEELKSEIDRIAMSTNFNGIPLLNGNLAGTPPTEDDPSGGQDDLQAFITQNDVTGIEHKNAVQKGAAWEGEIDFSKVYDGTTLVINGVTFEFNTDGTQNNAGAVNVSCAAGNAGSAAAALQAAILGSSLASDLDNCSVSGTGNLKLVQKDASAVNGKGFQISAGSSIPQVEYESAELKGIPGKSSSRLEIDDLNLNTIVDGTIIEFFGTKYEVDFDGILSSGHAILDLSGSGTKQNNLQNALNALSPNGTVKLFGGSSVGHFRVQLKYSTSFTTPNISDISFGSAADSSPPPSINATKNDKAINTPEVLPKNATRTDEIDFSLFQDGDSITVQGTTFEFDTDGALGDGSNISVDISSITDPSDMAAALKAAFDASGITGLTLSTVAVDSNKATVQIDSTSPIEGEKIELEYKVAQLDDEEGDEDNDEDEMEEDAGLMLKIGPGKEGEVYITLESMTTEALGISSICVSSEKEAAEAIEVIRKAVNKVSDHRGTLGATQNRLEHTINNLGVSHENLTAAETRISGADMAEEMMNLTKFQIIAQSAQSMQAQSRNLTMNNVQQLLQL